MDTVRRLREDGIDAVYGDATKRDTLEAAGAAHAGTLILTSAGMGSAAEVIRMARELNPKVQVLARGLVQQPNKSIVNAIALAASSSAREPRNHRRRPEV